MKNTVFQVNTLTKDISKSTSTHQHTAAMSTPLHIDSHDQSDLLSHTQLMLFHFVTAWKKSPCGESCSGSNSQSFSSLVHVCHHIDQSNCSKRCQSVHPAGNINKRAELFWVQLPTITECHERFRHVLKWKSVHATVAPANAAAGGERRGQQCSTRCWNKYSCLSFTAAYFSRTAIICFSPRGRIVDHRVLAHPHRVLWF